MRFLQVTPRAMLRFNLAKLWVHIAYFAIGTVSA
jgi:hypothetical protein